ncbi:Kef-type K+ transport system, membrane component KefB [Enhydrobacter aerosaccus]|uniref:Kef-type K+ transport system, membrane component KefB n=1 Tax=Enhydrobacter aerosaccus TaxID=225324 RepID=A0A1T4MQL3_9HYPH|nr:cation:proton antiporter [Enhydrobacter aerosaccus]SJZ69117.1 Kef-type K+ transport system, membrane component KefB [Enhydrobacter aerosaccus]
MNNHQLILVLLEISIIIGLARVMGALFKRLNQPPVIGEIIAGIMLGPSLFGLVAPAEFALLFPADLQKFLYLLAQIGLIFFMFLVGLGVDPDHLKSKFKLSLLISQISILLPMLLGAVLALHLLYDLNDLPGVARGSFAVFIGAAMSITAFPVLARILTDLELGGTALGTLALACASIDDLGAWCLLAIAIAMTKTHSIDAALPTIVGIGLYAVVMATAGRAALKYFLSRYGIDRHEYKTLFTFLYVLVTFSALFTEWIGIDVIFGGFIIGAVMPKGSKAIATLKAETENFVSTFLLPIFFAYSGLNTRIGLLDSPSLWLVCLIVVGVAIAGKFVGVYATARLGGVPRQEAQALGWLMNTRGLTELIILNVALKLGVISPTIFTIFVIMALITTMMTSPLVTRVALPYAPSRPLS